MPLYMVTCDVPQSNVSGMKVRCRAANKSEAIQQALTATTISLVTVRKCVAIPDHDQEYWRGVWWRALQNCPATAFMYSNWIETVKGRTPVGTYIRRLARGTMRQNEAGNIEALVKTDLDPLMGQMLNLAYLLEYKPFYGARHLKHHSYQTNYKKLPFWSVMRGLVFGIKPRDKKRAFLLEQLAKPDGAEFARKLRFEKQST